MWERDGKVATHDDRVSHADHRVELDDSASESLAGIEGSFRDAGLAPPELSDVTGEHGSSARDLIALLERRGTLVPIVEQRWVHRDALSAIEARMRERAASDPMLDVGSFKELAGVSRKFAIPLLEYFDRQGVTRREGNARRILL